MAFQLTRLNVPNLTTDFSAETNAAAQLGQTLGNLIPNMRKQAEADQKRELFAAAAKTGDFNKIGLALLGAGDAQGGAALLGLGQKTKELQLQEDAYKNSPFSGGTLGSPRPQASSLPGTASLIQNESGGNFQAQNSAVGAGGAVGHFGRAQFGQARLQEAAAAGAIPPGTTPQQFMASPEMQQRAEAWHFNDIDQSIKQNGFDRLVGQASIGGVPVTVEGLRAVAHLGGKEGMRKFVETQGAYNPADENGTRLSDYFARHGGGGQGAPAQTQTAQAPAGVPQGGGTYAGVPPERLQMFIDNPRVPENLKTMMRQEIASRGGGQQPVQVAQAAPQPGAPVSDVPAQGASQAGFNVPGSGIPPNDPAPQVTNQQLIAIQANPRLASQHDVAKQILANRQKYSDENAPDKREQQRLTTEKLRREVEGEGGRPMTAAERQSFGVREGQPAFIKKNGDPGFGPAGTSITNANTFDGKGESKFNEALGAAQAKRWNGYIEEGDIAQGRIADIQTLRDASRRLGSQGSSANLKATIGPFAESLGIKIEGLPDIQLYESIANRLAPQMRAPGSGSTSDIEFKGFMRAIGPLSNTPAAREMIFDTFEAASRNDLARSEIASRLAEGQINRGQAEKEIRALPNPLEGFKKFREANPDVVGQAMKDAAMTQAAQKREPAKVASPDEARKLPSGTVFIDPNGVQRRVP